MVMSPLVTIMLIASIKLISLVLGHIHAQLQCQH